MKTRNVVVWSAVILAVIVAVLWWGWRRQALWGDQIRNTVVFNDYRKALRYFHNSHGRYPDTLKVLPAEFRNVIAEKDCDHWGFPLIYRSDGGGYVLASNGRDGQPDGHDYWALRGAHQDDADAVNICMNWTADQIASDRGWHQVCGK